MHNLKNHMVMILVTVAATNAAQAKEKTIDFKDKGPGYEADFTYPAHLKSIPALNNYMKKEQADLFQETKAAAKDVEELISERIKSGDNMAVIDRQQNWQTIANLPGYVSLSVSWYTYDGGAHGLYGTGAKIWDKKAGKAVDPISLFVSKKAFDAEIQTRFCDKLDSERSSRRDGEKVDRSKADDWTQACPTPSDYVVLIGSSNGKTFDRMAVYVGPYGAGPYSEGAYEIDMPMTAKLVAAVKPQYRNAFSVKK
jgi:Deacetylase PdaC